eukprot:CAMPEP_0170119826 /NCGR_PEP_ID=MMETSP0020_2-20130122/14688_1 /TAXON_ID=98059 /ORGANISM="Dinobryon sp., Strain UTEXLB2267" /LENGTH=183 /DNA_ID=CAMNT_0010349393 /DNA_START=22 /DNA_END=570 /DNA_ORIENTATION=+
MAGIEQNHSSLVHSTRYSPCNRLKPSPVLTPATQSEVKPLPILMPATQSESRSNVITHQQAFKPLIERTDANENVSLFVAVASDNGAVHMMDFEHVDDTGKVEPFDAKYKLLPTSALSKPLLVSAVLERDKSFGGVKSSKIHPDNFRATRSLADVSTVMNISELKIPRQMRILVVDDSAMNRK